MRSRERAQLVDLRAQLRVEPLVLERQPGRGAHRVARARCASGSVASWTIAATHCAVALDRRDRRGPHRPPAARPARPSESTKRSPFGQPVVELERRVVERLRQRVSQIPPAGASASRATSAPTAPPCAMRARTQRAEEQVRHERERQHRKEGDRDQHVALPDRRLERELSDQRRASGPRPRRTSARRAAARREWRGATCAPGSEARARPGRRPIRLIAVPRCPRRCRSARPGRRSRGSRRTPGRVEEEEQRQDPTVTSR